MASEAVSRSIPLDDEHAQQVINELLLLGDRPAAPIITDGHTSIPNYLLTDNRLPDSTIRIYGTLLNLARPLEGTPSVSPAIVAITLAITLEAPGAFTFRNRRACEVRLPKLNGNKITREWDVTSLPAQDGPVGDDGETEMPNAVLTDTRLSNRDVRLYGILRLHKRREEDVAIAPQALMLWLLSSTSERSLQNSVTALKNAGYITPIEHRQYNVPPVYKLNEI